MKKAFWKKPIIICLLAVICLGVIAGAVVGIFLNTDEPAAEEEIMVGKTGFSYEDFTDVESHWANQYIKAMVKLGIARGRTDTAFMPDEYLTRAELIEMVAYASDLEDAEYKGVYSDVTAAEEYAPILQAAYDAGIIDKNFVAGNTLDADVLVTRQEIASMIAAGYKVLTGQEADAAQLDAFTQADPQGNVTRADAARILYYLQDCGEHLIYGGFDEGIGDWGTKIRTDTTSVGYENGEGEAFWSETEGHKQAGALGFDMAYTGKKQINAFQWDYTVATKDDNNIVDAGKSYMVCFFAKIEGAEAVKLNVIKMREQEDNNVEYSNVESTVLSGEGWQLYCVELSALTSVRRMKLIFQAGGCENYNTKIYIDDISLQQYDAKVFVRAQVAEEYQEVSAVQGVGVYAPYEQVRLEAAGEKVKNGKQYTYYLPDAYVDPESGNILAQGSEYSFTVTENTLVEVTYQQYPVVEKEWELEASGKLPKVNLKEATFNDTGVTVSARVRAPEGYTVVDCGAVYYDGSYVESFTLFTEGAVVVDAQTVGESGSYEVVREEVSDTVNTLVKPYAICKNPQGEYILIYGEETVCRTAGSQMDMDFQMIYNYELLNCFNSESVSNYTVWSEKFDDIATTDTDMITLTPSFYRTNMWQTQADTHWTEYAPTQEDTGNQIYERIKAYILDGGDPFQDMLDIVRDHGYETVFVNYRMNDNHQTQNENYATHNQFYLEHPEYWLNPMSTTNNRVLNYMEPEVRDYYFSLLEELVTNYDVDGLELDFERHPLYFYSSDVEAGTQLMTKFVGRVRAMLDEVGKQKGKYLPLSVRVPESLEEALSIGLDVAAWDALGYIDIVNVTSSYYNVLSLDVEGYRETLNEQTRVYAELQYVVRQLPTDSSVRGYTTAECLKATAESYYARGVDGISVFNMDYSLNKTKTFEGLTGITDEEGLKTLEKHYLLKRGYDFTTKDGNATVTTVLPVDSALYDLALLRVETLESSRDTVLEVYVNGTKLEYAEEITLTDRTELFPRLVYTEAYAEPSYLHYYTLPLECLKNGENTVEVKYVSGTECIINYIELGIYYADSYALKGEARDPKTMEDGMISSVEGDLLVNGDFNYGSTKWTANFRKDYHGVSGTVSYPETEGVNGSKCVLFEIDDAGTAAGGIQLYQIMEDVDIKAGRIYRVTFSAKLTGADSIGNGRIWLRNNESTSVMLGEVKNVVISGSEWKTYTVDITTKKGSEGSRLLIQFGGDSTKNAKLYFDSISLVNIGAAPKDPDEPADVAGNLLTNGSFGSGKSKWSTNFKTNLEAAGEATYPKSGGVENSKYLCMEIQQPGNAVGAIELCQTVSDTDIVAGKVYRITFWGKVTGAESVDIGRIWLRNCTGSAVTLGEVKNITVSGDQWTAYTADIIANTSSATGDGFRLMFHLGGDGTTNAKLHLDQISLVELGDASALVTCTVTKPTGSDFIFTGADTVAYGSDYTFTVVPTDGTTALEVKVNGTVVQGVDGTYTVANVTEDLVITVSEYLGENLLEQGDCEGGVGKWALSANSGKGGSATKSQAASGGVDDSKYLLLDITSSGTADGAVQLYQNMPDVDLMAGTTYRLTFYAKVSGADSLTFSQIRLRNYGSPAKWPGTVENVTVSGAEWTRYTVDIPVTASYEGCKLYFNIAGGYENVQLHLDNLHLTQLENETPTDPTDPTDPIDPTDPTDPTEPETPAVNNLLEQGDCETGVGRWTVSAKNGGSATKSWAASGGVDDSKYLLLDITSSGTADGAVQLYQNMPDVDLMAGTTYRLTFYAKVSGADSLTFSQIRLRNYGSPAEWPGTVSNVTVSGEEWTQYTVDITVNGSYEGSKLYFNLASGYENVQLHLDNLCLVALETQTEETTYTVTLPTGEGYTVTGEATVAAGENYSFTVTPDNSEATVAVTVNGEVVTGTNGVYTVFNVTSDLVITVTVTEPATPGGTNWPVEGSLLTNGGFDSGKSPWSTSSSNNGASATITYPTSGGVDNGRYANFAITSSGTADGSVQLYQTMADAVITAGKTYRVTFWAKVSGAESASFVDIRLRNNETTAGWLGYTSNIAVTGDQWAAYTVDIEATAGSTGARLLFRFAKNISGATVCLDHIALVELGEQTEETTYTVTLPTGEGYTVTGETTVAAGENYSFTVTPDNSEATVAVTVNGEVVTGENGTYTVTNVTSDLVIAVTVTEPVQTLVNLLEQGDCETGVGRWTVSAKNGGSATKSWAASGGVDDSKYLLLDITSSGTADGAVQLYQNMPDVDLMAGTTYRLTFYAKVSGADSLTFSQIRLRNYDTAAAWPGTVSNVTVSGTQWTKYTVNITVDASYEGSKLYFNIASGYENVQLYLDNLCLVELNEG